MAETTSSVYSNVGVKDLLDAGLHFGHQSKRWNPKMKRFIFDKRNGIYIIDLTRTLAQLKYAQEFIYDVVAKGKKVVFVGTKRHNQDVVQEVAENCGQFFVNTRWLGGTLTNFGNIQNSIERYKELREREESGELNSMSQKEASRLRHELARLRRNLSGIVEMQQTPAALIVADINCDAIAVKEANRLNIPVIALVDTNCDPDPIRYPIPGNDDSIRSVKCIMDALSETISKASAEYEKVAAEIARKKEEERKAAEAKATAAAEAAKARKKQEKEEAKKARVEAKAAADKKAEETKDPAKQKPETAPPPETPREAESAKQQETSDTGKAAEDKAATGEGSAENSKENN